MRHVTVGAILTRGDQIMLVKRAETQLLEGGKWGLPGGFFDRDETAEEAVQREILEETGYQSSNIRLMLINTNPNRPKEDRQNVDMVFSAEAGDKTQDHDDESSETRWFDKDKLPAESEIAFDHAMSLNWYLENPDHTLKLIGLSL